MKRNRLFQRILLGAAALTFMLFALNSCSKDKDEEEADNTFEIDLSDPAYLALKSEGGWVIIPSKQILVFYTGKVWAGLYGAADSQCTCCGGTLKWEFKPDVGSSTYFCQGCNSRWGMNCAVVSGPATVAIKDYMAQANGNILTIHLGI